MLFRQNRYASVTEHRQPLACRAEGPDADRTAPEYRGRAAALMLSWHAHGVRAVEQEAFKELGGKGDSGTDPAAYRTPEQASGIN